MGNESEDVAPPYGPDELKRFAEILGKSNLSKSCADQFQRAALAYEFMADTDRSRTTRAQRRKAYKRIETAAQELRDALDTADPMIVDGKPRLPISDTRILAELVKDAKEASERVPPTGPDPEQARTVFVRDLASIYMHVTKRQPGRIAKYKEGSFEKEYGPFRDLVVAALEPLDPDASTGINDVIRKVLRERSRQA